ncbi:MAG: arylesterase [Sphingobacteriaceae bacterium]|nr:arylesterase [Sphingobacteriaceae bacterium]
MRYLQSILLLMVAIMAACNNENSPKTGAKNQQDDSDSVKLRKTILFFGNSLTAGYGLEDPDEAFPAVIQRKIDSLDLPYKVINAGLSGETTAGGVNRINWLLKQTIDIFVLELGANDGLRGIPVTETRKNLQSILDTVKVRYPNAKRILLGMEVPPNMGGKYASDFRVIFRELAEKNKIPFVPFMLEGVAGNVKLNLRDGIHPTGEGYKIVAENVWEVLKNEL